MNKEMRPKLIESFIGNLATIGINLLFPLVVTHIYGKTILGEFTYNASVLMTLIFFASLGLSTGLMYFIPREGKKYISSSFIITLALTTILVGIGFLLTENQSMYYMLPLLYVFTFEQLFFAIFRANHQIKEYFFTNLIVHNGGKVILALIFGTLFEADFMWLAIASYISGLGALIIYFLKQRHMFGKIYFSFYVIKYSLPLSIGSVVFIIMMQLDKIMVGNILGTDPVAIYGVASSMAYFPSIFLTSLNTIFPPIIAQLYHEKQYVKLKEFYQKSVRYLIFFSGIVIAFIVLFRYQLLGLYGESYKTGATVLVYISVGQFVNAAVGSVWYIVIMTGHPRINLMGKLLGLVVNVVLNYLLIPIHGINGAAFATMTSTAFVNIVGFFVVKQILNHSVNKQLQDVETIQNVVQ